MAAAMNSSGGSGEPVRVWDLFVRIFHWSVATAFFIAWFTEDDFITIHAWAGYTVGALVVLRIAWGFTGPRHARFVDFVYPPVTVWRYLKALASGHAKRYLGHSPAGGAMVIALLTCLLLVVWTGLELYALEEGKGPLARTAVRDPDISAHVLMRAARASGGDGRDRPRESGESGAHDFWEELHESLANAALVLVILHVIGVVWSSIVHRENLARSMVTGAKRTEP